MKGEYYNKLGLKAGKYRNILGDRKKYWVRPKAESQYFFLEPNIFRYLPDGRPNLVFIPPGEFIINSIYTPPPSRVHEKKV